MSVGVGSLVGRSAERTTIERAIGVARAGQGSAVLLAGAAGIGKSALLAWAIDHAADFLTLTARGATRSASEPFSLIRALIESASAPATESPVPEAEVVSALIDGGEVSTERYALGLRMVAYLSALAERAPVLIVVDDVQWADASSVDALRTAFDRLTDDPILFLFAVRSGEISGFRDGDLALTEVGELSVDEARELIAGLLAPSVAREVAERSIGNPLVLTQLVAGLDAEQRSGARPLDERMFESPTPEHGFLSRVDELGREARFVLRLASADSAIEEQLLGDVATELCADAEVVSSLVEQGYLVADHDGSNLEFAHPLLRVAVYQAMPDSARRAAHAAIAARLPDAQLYRRAWHLAAAADGFDDSAAQMLENAAASARDRGAYAVAGQTFARSAALTADEQMRARRLTTGAEAFFAAGDVEPACRMLDDALALASDQALRADIQLARASISHTQPSGGFYDELVAEAEATAAIDTSRAAMLFAHATFAANLELRVDEVRHACARAVDLVGEGDPAAGIAQFGQAGADMIVGGYARAVPVWRAFADMVEQVGPGPEVGGLADYVANAFSTSGEFERCRAISVSLIEYERSVGALGMLPRSLAVYANTLFRTGNWPAALAAADEAVGLARETRQHIELAQALVVAMLVEAATGQFDAARERANEVVPFCENSRMRYFELSAFAALGFFELTTGNFAAAKAVLTRNQHLANTFSIRCPTLVMWQPDLVDAASRLGDRPFASEISAQLTADAELNSIPYGFALAARCRGTIAVDIDDARGEFQAALRWHDAVADPFQRARTQLAFGERLAAGGAADDAVEPLTAAVGAFARLGAAPWEQRARRHLPVGTPPDTHARSPMQLLTARELQVALLVIDGTPSRDVAAELFLSRRTVEYHLAAIYRKLGVTNRTQLARIIYPHVDANA